MLDEYKYAQGPAKLANHEDIVRDESGITKPNLHRRIDEDMARFLDNCYLITQDNYILETQDDYDIIVDVDTPDDRGDKFALSVNGVNSYRTTFHVTHDEDSTTSEIP